MSFSDFRVFGLKTEPDNSKQNIFISILPQMDIRALTRFLPMICGLHLYYLYCYINNDTQNAKILKY